MDKEQHHQKKNKIPKHYRQHKYHQYSDGPVSEQKQKKMQERNENHKLILEEYKKNYKYFDAEANEHDKTQYYSKLQNPHVYEELHQLISGTFKHAKRRENIFPIVDRHPDYTLRCVYSGKILSDPEGNFFQKCDEEHSFPQSYQRGTKSGTGRDMHAIFAASKEANGSRGNTPFGKYSEEQKQIESDQFGTTYSGKPKKTYVPKINSGAVARSTLYILVCYKNSANPSYFPKQTLPWLIEQAASSEVTEWQKHRNQELYRLQGNRNPFIDFPELAKCIDFSAGWQKQ